MKILLVTEDDALSAAIQHELNLAKHRCALCKDAAKALASALTGSYDAILLDMLLRNGGSRELLGRFREHWLSVPTIILTPLDAVNERIEAIALGVDDYLIVPISPAELLARLNAIARRASGLVGPQLIAGELSLDSTTRKVVRNGNRIELTPIEFNILEYLMRNQNKVVSKRTLGRYLWDQDLPGSDNLIQVHIGRLRAKIDRRFQYPLLHTVRSRGYVLRPPTSDDEDASSFAEP